MSFDRDYNLMIPFTEQLDMRKKSVVVLAMVLTIGVIQPAHADRYSGSVAAGVVAGLVGGILLSSAIAGSSMYAGPPPMYGSPAPGYAPPPYYYAGSRCYWTNVQEWVGYGWSLIPRQVCY
ncbi:DUF5957 family protein [Burkholderia sp. HI2500]|uniref:DUF5957 family protein n=1 Tax=Burkholderia sp. HI2500 TaxID=2015358 RepID=UPI00117E4843|nr:DUF5957 family protein [Burkholderia sp. HI2500]